MTIRFEAAGAEFTQARCEVVARWSSVGYLYRLSDDLKVLAGRELGPRSYRGCGSATETMGSSGPEPELPPCYQSSF